MNKNDLEAGRELAALKDRLHSAKAKLTITVEANDDTLIAELLNHLGGHTGSAGGQRSLDVSGDHACSIIALACGLRSLYEPKLSPRRFRLGGREVY